MFVETPTVGTPDINRITAMLTGLAEPYSEGTWGTALWSIANGLSTLDMSPAECTNDVIRAVWAVIEEFAVEEGIIPDLPPWLHQIVLRVGAHLHRREQVANRKAWRGES